MELEVSDAMVPVLDEDGLDEDGLAEPVLGSVEDALDDVSEAEESWEDVSLSDVISGSSR